MIPYINDFWYWGWERGAAKVALKRIRWIIDDGIHVKKGCKEVTYANHKI
jgi:hypothetical protein